MDLPNKMISSISVIPGTNSWATSPAPVIKSPVQQLETKTKKHRIPFGPRQSQGKKE
jgi:hypothetical protein